MARRQSFGSIRKLSSGRFQARYKRDGFEYKAPVTFASESDADLWLTEVGVAIRRGVWQDPSRTGPSLARYGATWIDERPGLKDSTRTRHREVFAAYIEPYLGSWTLEAITPELVRHWHTKLGEDLAKRLASGTSRREATRRNGSTTTARAYRLLRTMMNTAVEDRIVRENPCILKGAGTTKASERPTLSVDEVRALADTVPDRYRALVLLLAYSGLRKGEACALRRSDLDLTPGREAVHVQERVYYISGMGNDYEAPKTGASVRWVALPSMVAQALAEHMDAFTGGEHDALVFTTRTGANAYNGIGPIISRRLDEMGRTDVRVHDLRHTGQTLAANAGASPAELMRRMGHVTMDASLVYLHGSDERDRAVARELDEIAKSGNVVGLSSRRRRRA